MLHLFRERLFNYIFVPLSIAMYLFIHCCTPESNCFETAAKGFELGSWLIVYHSSEEILSSTTNNREACYISEQLVKLCSLQLVQLVKLFTCHRISESQDHALTPQVAFIHATNDTYMTCLNASVVH